MIRRTFLFSLLLAFGVLRLPIETALSEQYRTEYFQRTVLGLELRDRIGQLGFLAALSGFRSLVADLLFIEAHVAWERTEWGRVYLLFHQATTLQPRSVRYWEMAAWHMAWNASVAMQHDRALPNDTVRRQAGRTYIALGKDFLERGIRNNPDRPQLYEALARLYREKLQNHLAAAGCYSQAAALPGAPEYVKRFAAYELSYAPGHEQEAYAALCRLYNKGERQRLPTLIQRLKTLEEKLDIPLHQRIPGRQM